MSEKGNEGTPGYRLVGLYIEAVLDQTCKHLRCGCQGLGRWLRVELRRLLQEALQLAETAAGLFGGVNQ